MSEEPISRSEQYNKLAGLIEDGPDLVGKLFEVLFEVLKNKNIISEEEEAGILREAISRWVGE